MAAAATEVALRAVGFADPPPPRGFLFQPRFVGICGARLWVSVNADHKNSKRFCIVPNEEVEHRQRTTDQKWPTVKRSLAPKRWRRSQLIKQRATSVTNFLDNGRFSSGHGWHDGDGRDGCGHGEQLQLLNDPMTASHVVVVVHCVTVVDTRGGRGARIITITTMTTLASDWVDLVVVRRFRPTRGRRGVVNNLRHGAGFGPAGAAGHPWCQPLR